MLKWLRKIFEWRGTVEARRDAGEAPRMVSVTGDDYYDANSDILDGVRFSATLQLRTPLAVLERHGEVFRGPPSKAPNYGGMADGIWMPNVAGSVGEALSQGRSYASDAGPVIDTEYLPFLKAFRTIVEGPSSAREKLSALRLLPRTSPAFGAFWRKLEKNVPDFPESFFYMKLTEIEGVGRTTAKRLFDSGFTTLEDVRSATDDALLAVKGVGKGLVAKIRVHQGLGQN